MNFFQAQAKAKKNSLFLLFLFVLSVVLTSIIIAIVVLLILTQSSTYSSYDIFYIIEHNQFLFFGKIIPSVFGILLFGSVYKFYELSRYGGNRVAQSLGGRLILRDTKDVDEQKLLNVVEEMSIASGISVPPVYILNDNSINAFAAGFSLDDVAIGVTKGCIEKLNRDELQGVVAHEYSHIFNGDMNLNMKLVGGLHGLLFIKELGRILMESSSHVSSSRSEGRSQAFLLGVLVFVVGFIGYLCGELIKAFISRQREYLADASAVQYTRNPYGIANALKKIGGDVFNKEESLKQEANLYSHMFFSNIASLFSTHPPIDKRIKRIDKNWDETYILDLPNKNQVSQMVYENKNDADNSMKLNVEHIFGVLASLGAIDQGSVDEAKDQIKNLPDEILEQLNSTFESVGLALALVIDKDSKKASKQFDYIEDVYDIKTVSIVRQIWLTTKKMNKQELLITTELLVSRLMQLSKEQYIKLKKSINRLIEIDGVIDFYEWLLKQLIIHKLDIYFQLKVMPKITISSNKKVKKEIEIVLSTFLYFELQDDTLAGGAFLVLSGACTLTNMEYIPSNKQTFESLEHSLEKLKECDVEMKKNILEALVEGYKIDDMISVNEYYLLKVLGVYFNLPIPLTYLKSKDNYDY
jgi:Zn-dependent protease with chaperone function